MRSSMAWGWLNGAVIMHSQINYKSTNIDFSTQVKYSIACIDPKSLPYNEISCFLLIQIVIKAGSY